MLRRPGRLMNTNSTEPTKFNFPYYLLVDHEDTVLDSLLGEYRLYVYTVTLACWMGVSKEMATVAKLQYPDNIVACLTSKELFGGLRYMKIEEGDPDATPLDSLVELGERLLSDSSLREATLETMKWYV